tara:strand:- start:374 stop:2053 length:1680 start_codon:yes stop_codon:yes gene_type:complete
MSKISRKKLAKGVKLTTDHIYQPLTDIGSSIAVPTDRMKCPNGVFRLNFSVPVINHGVSKTKSDYHVAQPAPPAAPREMNAAECIPFILPPLQEFFDATEPRNTTKDTPSITLEEISISFDTRGEAAAIRFGKDANLDYSSIDKSSIQVSIVEKPISKTLVKPTREVESIKIDHIMMDNIIDRQNPFVIDNLGRPIDPYGAYLLKIEANDLHVLGVGATPIQIVSLHISLKFKHPLVARASSDLIQNAPDKPAPSRETINIQVPATDTVVAADGNEGVQDEIKRIDDLFINRLQAGMGKDGAEGAYSHLRADSSYEVIAVPMWGNFGKYQIVTSANVKDSMYFSAGSVCDRRIISINYPLIIHHVIAACNYTDVFCGGSAATLTTIPVMPGSHFTHKVGVGLGSGVRSDFAGYQEIAYLEFAANAAATPNTIDRMISHHNSSMCYGPWEFETWNIPIHATPTPGVGFGTQGQPYYVGRSSSNTSTRTMVGDPLNPGQATAPATEGREQWVEVRWSLNSSGVGGTLNDPTANELYVGSGGNWVYLICQKPLVGGQGDLNI